MLTSSERALVETIRTYAKDPALTAPEGHTNDTLHVHVDFGAGRRHLTLDHTSKHDLAALDEQQRTDVIAALFRNATTWPEGIVEVRCILDVLQTPDLTAHTDIQVFIGDVPLDGVRISAQMRVKS